MKSRRTRASDRGTLSLGTEEPGSEYFGDEAPAWQAVEGNTALRLEPPTEVTLAEDDYATLIGGYTTVTSYRMPPTMTWAEYCRALAVLSNLQTAVQWWLGDALVRGKRLFGEQFAQAALVATKLAPSTLQDLHYVCARIAPTRRDPELSFSHHREVANLEPAQQIKWLKYAREHGHDGQPMAREDFRQVLQARGVGSKRTQEEALGLRRLKKAFDKATPEDIRAFLLWMPRDRVLTVTELLTDVPTSTRDAFRLWWQEQERGTDA